MKRTITNLFSAVTVFIIFVAINSRTTTWAESVDTRIGKLDFELGVPTPETVTKLYDGMDCQAYLGTYRHRVGHAFDGGQNYHLHVPPDPPAKQFWSITLYDVNTRGLIQNQEQIADRSSCQPGLVKNADGSVDLFFGPNVSRGMENNRIPTVPGRTWFAGIRLNAPLEPYFDKTWLLPDIEKVK